MSNGKRQKQEIQFNLLLSEYERKEFERAAGARGMTISAWIRAACRDTMLRERVAAVTAKGG